MSIGKDLDLMDGALPDSDNMGREVSEDGLVAMMESLGWDVAKDNISVVPDGDSKIVVRNLNREED